MGIEVGLILGGLSALVSVVGGIASANAASQAAGAQKEARAIGAAQTQVQQKESLRQKVREQRIRKAQILAASENAGTNASSGQIGAIGALSTNLAGMLGLSLGESRANDGINKQNQKAADFMQQADTIGAWTDAIKAGIGGFKTVFDDK